MHLVSTVWYFLKRVLKQVASNSGGYCKTGFFLLFAMVLILRNIYAGENNLDIILRILRFEATFYDQ